MFSRVSQNRDQTGSLRCHEGQIPEASRGQVNADQTPTKPIGSTAQMVVEMTHRGAVAGTEVEHGFALLGQEQRRVSLGSQHASTEFGPVRIPSSVLVTREFSKRFTVDGGTGNGVARPQGSAVQPNGGGQLLGSPLPALFSSAHGFNLIDATVVACWLREGR